MTTPSGAGDTIARPTPKPVRPRPMSMILGRSGCRGTEATDRSKERRMRLVLIGLLCSLVGGVVAFFAGCLVLGVLYLPSHPVVEWLVTDPYTLAHAVPFFWDGL